MKITRRKFLIGASGLAVIGKVFDVKAKQVPQPEFVAGGEGGMPVRLFLMSDGKRTKFSRGAGFGPKVHFRFAGAVGKFTGYEIEGPDGKKIGGMKFEGPIWSQAGDTISIDWSPVLREA